MSKPFVIASFYRFVPLPDFARLQAPLMRRCRELNLKGTILLAPEGVNGAVAGSREGVDALLRCLRSARRFEDLEVRRSRAAECPFQRLKVKLRRELVSLGAAGADPALRRGRYVEPEQWNALITEPGTLVLDVRNQYECELGSFRNSRSPGAAAFREFPGYAERCLDPDEHEKIAMFCTGGIRCEKASSYLLSRGFKDVAQLRGGILNYFERIGREDSLWQGECFVFDGRVAVDHELAEGNYQQCFACRRPLGAQDLESAKYQPGVSCPRCHDELSPAQRRRFSERQRQVELALKRGGTHLGAAP